MDSSLKTAVERFIQQEKLPANYADTVTQWFLPLAENILRKVSVSSQAIVVGISGCQGSGKSTLASLLVVLLRQMLGIKGINISIDDFYLSHVERESLGHSIHPLLATRGVPGSHDVELAVDTINALRKSGEVAIPRFNKAIDDRLPKHEWTTVQAPVDVIILEGWCLNIGPQAERELSLAINELEANEDSDGTWRAYVNQQLQERYQTLYNMVDYLIMLKAPSFEKVFEWRQTQEDKLAAQHVGDNNTKIMSETELKRFIQHYERITRHGLLTLPEQADVVFQLTDEQTVLGLA